MLYYNALELYYKNILCFCCVQSVQLLFILSHYNEELFVTLEIECYVIIEIIL